MYIDEVEKDDVVHKPPKTKTQGCVIALPAMLIYLCVVSLGIYFAVAMECASSQQFIEAMIHTSIHMILSGIVGFCTYRYIIKNDVNYLCALFTLLICVAISYAVQVVRLLQNQTMISPQVCDAQAYAHMITYCFCQIVVCFVISLNGCVLIGFGHIG